MANIPCSECGIPCDETKAPIRTKDNDYICCITCYERIDAENRRLLEESERMEGGPRLWG